METPKTADSSAVPKAIWERILTTTPVIMTILSTLLAGLSSSEMTQAQYHRSLAAQYQSKAGDQWGFFQAKKIREASLKGTGDLLQGLREPGKLDARALKEAARRLVGRLKRSEEKAGDWDQR